MMMVVVASESGCGGLAAPCTGLQDYNDSNYRDQWRVGQHFVFPTQHYLSFLEGGTKLFVYHKNNSCPIR